jgi:20S proteasome alpha/beta subunit
LLLAGRDGTVALYYLDYLGFLQIIPYAAQRYSAYFVMSVFDKHFTLGRSLDEGKRLMKLALGRLRRRFAIARICGKVGRRRRDKEDPT